MTATTQSAAPQGRPAAFLVGLFLPCLLLFLATIDGAGFPGWGLGWLVVLVAALLVALAALGLLTVSIIWALQLTGRRFPTAWAFFAGGILFGVLPALAIPEAAKPLAARIVAVRAQPIIDAVEAFHNDHGVLPISLDELVPTYLTGPVRTGSPAYPEIHFSRGKDPNGDWALEVPMTELMGFDSLYYCPVDACDDLEGDGEIVATTRYGRWVYVVD